MNRRKEEWKNAIEKRVYGKIKDIEAHTAYPASFTVIARVVNYEPRDLKSCSIVYCSMCKKMCIFLSLTRRLLMPESVYLPFKEHVSIVVTPNLNLSVTVYSSSWS